MKKYLYCILCVIFILTFIHIPHTYCGDLNTIELTCQNRVFHYDTNKNIKKSDQFDLNFQLNRYNRFGSIAERQNLLNKMLNLNFEKNVAINYIFPNFEKFLQKIEKNVNILAKNAKLTKNSSTEKVFSIQKEVVGRMLDREKTYSILCEKFLSNEPLTFEIPLIKIAPAITQEFYQKYTNLRSDFSTYCSSSNESRKHNIKNALNSLNLIEILPGETFSFNQTVGKRTSENGYRSAKIIVNNEFVDGLGGGVCQVSTTLYNSALLAGLDIVEANKHSKKVSYVQNGFDAMVNFGSSDLKFKNNTNDKIIIVTNFKNNNQVRIRIFGESLGNTKYELVSKTIVTSEPKEEVYVDEKLEHTDKVIYNDEYFYLKTASRGLEIQTFRNKLENGVVVSSKKLRTDKYPVQNSIKIYGAKERTIPFDSSDKHSLDKAQI